MTHQPENSLESVFGTPDRAPDSGAQLLPLENIFGKPSKPEPTKIASPSTFGHIQDAFQATASGLKILWQDGVQLSSLPKLFKEFGSINEEFAPDPSYQFLMETVAGAVEGTDFDFGLPGTKDIKEELYQLPTPPPPGALKEEARALGYTEEHEQAWNDFAEHFKGDDLAPMRQLIGTTNYLAKGGVGFALELSDFIMTVPEILARPKKVSEEGRQLVSEGKEDASTLEQFADAGVDFAAGIVELGLGAIAQTDYAARTMFNTPEGVLSDPAGGAGKTFHALAEAISGKNYDQWYKEKAAGIWAEPGTTAMGLAVFIGFGKGKFKSSGKSSLFKVTKDYLKKSHEIKLEIREKSELLKTAKTELQQTSLRNNLLNLQKKLMDTKATWAVNYKKPSIKREVDRILKIEEKTGNFPAVRNAIDPALGILHEAAAKEGKDLIVSKGKVSQVRVEKWMKDLLHKEHVAKRFVEQEILLAEAIREGRDVTKLDPAKSSIITDIAEIQKAQAVKKLPRPTQERKVSTDIKLKRQQAAINIEALSETDRTSLRTQAEKKVRSKNLSPEQHEAVVTREMNKILKSREAKFEKAKTTVEKFQKGKKVYAETIKRIEKGTGIMALKLGDIIRSIVDEPAQPKGKKIKLDARAEAQKLGFPTPEAVGKKFGLEYQGAFEYPDGRKVHTFTDFTEGSPSFKDTFAVKSLKELRGKVEAKRNKVIKEAQFLEKELARILEEEGITESKEATVKRILAKRKEEGFDFTKELEPPLDLGINKGFAGKVGLLKKIKEGKAFEVITQEMKKTEQIELLKDAKSMFEAVTQEEVPTHRKRLPDGSFVEVDPTEFLTGVGETPTVPIDFRKKTSFPADFPQEFVGIKKEALSAINAFLKGRKLTPNQTATLKSVYKTLRTQQRATEVARGKRDFKTGKIKEAPDKDFQRFLDSNFDGSMPFSMIIGAGTSGAALTRILYDMMNSEGSEEAQQAAAKYMGLLSMLGIFGVKKGSGRAENLAKIRKMVDKVVPTMQRALWQDAKINGIEGFRNPHRFGRLLLGTKNIFTGTGTRFKSVVGKRFTQLFDQTVIRSENIKGEAGEIVRRAIDSLPIKDRTKYRILGNYKNFDAAFNKSLNESIGEQMRQGKKAKDFPKGSTERTIAQGFEDAFEFYADLAESIGVQVINRDGSYSNFKRVSGQYFPEYINKEISKVVGRDLERVGELHKLLGEAHDVISEQSIRRRVEAFEKYYQTDKFSLDPKTIKLIEEVRKTSGMKTHGEAMDFLYSKSNGQWLHPFGSLSFHRNFKIPDYAVEKNVAEVFSIYAEGASRLIAETELWGKDKKILSGIMKELNASPYEQKAARTLMNIYSGLEAKKYDPTVRAVLRGMSTFEYLAKIATNLGPTIANMGQPAISYMLQTGFTSAVKSGFGLLYNFRERKAFVRKSGAVNSYAFRHLTGTEAEGMFSNIVNVTGFHFQLVNKSLQYLAADAGREFVSRLHDIANGTSKINQIKLFGKTRQGWARESLKQDYGIDYTKPLTETQLQQAAFKMARDSQLQGNLLREPLWMNTTLGKPVAVLKRFGVKQFHYAKDVVWKEIKRGNVLPLARAAMLGFLGGELVVWGRNTYLNLKDKSSNEIAKLVGFEGVDQTKDRQRYEEFLSWERAVNNWAAIATLGFVTDLVENPVIEALTGKKSKNAAQEQIGKAKFFLTPVILDDIFNMTKGFTEVAKQLDWSDHLYPNLRRAVKPALQHQPFTSARGLSSVLQTRLQYENSIRKRRGDVVSDAIRLIATGHEEDAVRRIKEWNNNNPAVGAFFNRDMTTKTVYRIHVSGQDITLDKIIDYKLKENQKANIF